ncbi:hypothetical protein PR048_012187 [Dryococelus australis]|uniref:Uncharacterized protein n=1 Tax=Dryococelus australis TaxID=614101 RepID=A0ABQ9HPD8_9NEOP|nr:hypothetical protein PR048_012187 [Dryococelus australis]
MAICDSNCTFRVVDIGSFGSNSDAGIFESSAMGRAFKGDAVDKIVKAAVCLHNFLKIENDRASENHRQYCPPNSVEHDNDDGRIQAGEWRNITGDALITMSKTRAHSAVREAYCNCEKLAEYLVTPAGEVPRHWDYIRRGQHRDQ